MDPVSKEVRAMLRGMAPAKSIPLIQSYQLPAEEEAVLILCDAQGCSVLQAALELNVSPETVWRRRRAALKKLQG